MTKSIYTCIILFTLISCHLKAQAPKTYTANDVKQQFIQSWNAYRQYAWGHDLLDPITKTYSDWYKQSLHISPIDAYSTMRVMGLDSQAKEVQHYVIDSVHFDKDIYVKTFEVNIRILGGMLAMYEYTHDPVILAKTKDFGDRLLKAFNSPTGIPYYWVNLKTGQVKGTVINVAEAGTYTFEMGILSYYTSDPKYYQAGKKATMAIYNRRSSIGLIGFSIDVETGKWQDSSSCISAGVDSYYEYMYKTWLLFKDTDLKQAWDNSITAINRYIADESDNALWYGSVDMHSGKRTGYVVTLYDAFFPAILALSGDTRRAAKFENTFYNLWTKYGLEPMCYDYKADTITYPVYDLNPEIIESAYYMYHFTHDKKYATMGQVMFSDIMKYCKTDIAFSSIADVRTMKQNNELPTFFFAETLKYFYLLFDGKPDFSLDNYVFNTEAHPFKKSDFAPAEIKKRLGI